jgi:hypothetical protein
MTTSEQIKEIYDKIENFIETQPKEQQPYLRYNLSWNFRTHQRKEKEFLILKTFGKLNECTIEHLEAILKEAKEQAAKLKDSTLRLSVSDDFKCSIVVKYTEAEEDVLDRLNKEYNRMIEQAKKSEENERATFLKLKSKFEPES